MTHFSNKPSKEAIPTIKLQGSLQQGLRLRPNCKPVWARIRISYVLHDNREIPALYSIDIALERGEFYWVQPMEKRIGATHIKLVTTPLNNQKICVGIPKTYIINLP